MEAKGQEKMDFSDFDMKKEKIMSCE